MAFFVFSYKECSFVDSPTSALLCCVAYFPPACLSYWKASGLVVAEVAGPTPSTPTLGLWLRYFVTLVLTA